MWSMACPWRAAGSPRHSSKATKERPPTGSGLRLHALSIALSILRFGAGDGDACRCWQAAERRLAHVVGTNEQSGSGASIATTWPRRSRSLKLTTDNTGSDLGRPKCRRCPGSSRYCSCCSNHTNRRPLLRHRRRRLHSPHRANRSQDSRLSGDPECVSNLEFLGVLGDHPAPFLKAHQFVS